MKKFLVRNGKGRAKFIFDVEDDLYQNVLDSLEYDPTKMSFVQESGKNAYQCIINFSINGHLLMNRLYYLKRKEYVYIETIGH